MFLGPGFFEKIPLAVLKAVLQLSKCIFRPSCSCFCGGPGFASERSVCRDEQERKMVRLAEVGVGAGGAEFCRRA